MRIQCTRGFVDATKFGNVARFSNHCCTANCEAQQIENKKQIVRYVPHKIFHQIQS